MQPLKLKNNTPLENSQNMFPNCNQSESSNAILFFHKVSSSCENKIYTNSNEVRAHSSEVRKYASEARAYANEVWAHANELRAHASEVRAHANEVRAHSICTYIISGIFLEMLFVVAISGK